MSEQRSQIAERFVESFAGVPLTAECVYRSPQYLDKGIQKEVCDFLIILRGEAILVSMKSQEDPDSRSGDKLERWILKNAERGLSQARGGLRTARRSQFWSQHSRRGRVDFEPDSLKLIHLVIATEVFSDRLELPEEAFPITVEGIPVTYLSVNDFCNLVYELRTFPDLVDYLSARRAMGAKTVRSIGDERPLFEYYLLNNRSFDGCMGYEDARITTAARQVDIEVYAYFKSVRGRRSGIIECVSDRLATRMNRCTEDLEPNMAAFYDDPATRRNYLLMQEELCDLRLNEREALGLQFTQVIEKVEKAIETETMAYGAAWVDSKPDFVYVLISAKGIDRLAVIKRSNILLRGAMANYQKARGMVIADRDGKNFEVQLLAGFEPGPINMKLGQEYFSHLKMSDVELGSRSSFGGDTTLIV